MFSVVFSIGLFGGLLYLLKMQKQTQELNLQFFKPSEFGIWFPFMDKKLLLGLDELRRQFGYPIMISPAQGSLGREDGNPRSQHFLRNGVVRAADIMPIKNGQSLNKKQLKDFYLLARSLNVFSGLGVYPDWRPYAGMHLDTRIDRTPENPALWGAYRDKYGIQRTTGLNNVLS